MTKYKTHTKIFNQMAKNLIYRKKLCQRLILRQVWN